MNCFLVHVHTLYPHLSYVPIYSNTTNSITLKILRDNNNNKNNNNI
jgi:hypothetical protein